MFIDSHTHIFNSPVIENVVKKTEMVRRLHLETDIAYKRIGVDTLENEMKAANIDACLILPTADAENIKKINSMFLEITEISKSIYTACTLHPEYSNNKEELRRFKEKNIRGIKLCSFSQGFALCSAKALDLFDMIRDENKYNECKFFIVLDTFYDASAFFGTDPKNNTTPALFGDLVKNYPEIKFIGAHMGGLNAPFKEILKYLSPAENLYLDTSNAAHTLENSEFLQLLKLHGPDRILFGTDWPWFGYKSEINLIQNFINNAGFTENHKAAVFGGNIAKLLGIVS